MGSNTPPLLVGDHADAVPLGQLQPAPEGLANVGRGVQRQERLLVRNDLLESVRKLDAPIELGRAVILLDERVERGISVLVTLLLFGSWAFVGMVRLPKRRRQGAA